VTFKTLPGESKFPAVQNGADMANWGMTIKAAKGRPSGAVKQFSVFAANRLGRLHDLIRLFSSRSVHALGLTVMDSAECSIIRVVVDDPETAREVLKEHGFAFAETDLLCVELDAANKLGELMSAMLEAELNINYLYSLIPPSMGKAALVISMEDNEVAEKVLSRRAFRVLRQGDISR
jgi:hypothetical protein